MKPVFSFTVRHRGSKSYSRFSDEFFLAPGAGDGDFPLPSGHPHQLAALGAVKVAVVPILRPVHQLQKFTVLPIALVGVPGQGAPNRPDHQAVAQHYQQQVHRRMTEEHRQQAHRQTHAQDHHI